MMWNGKTLAVVLPTYNEADSIAECIKRFDALGIVDEIVVVNNNAHPDTSPAVAGTGAREVHEVHPGVRLGDPPGTRGDHARSTWCASANPTAPSIPRTCSSCCRSCPTPSS